MMPATEREASGDAALREEVIDALRTVFDPEIPVNIYDLGLIYRVDILPDFHVDIDMTLTAPGCPVAGEMLRWAEGAVRTIDRVRQVTMTLVFEPPWDQSLMADAAKLDLGLM